MSMFNKLSTEETLKTNNKEEGFNLPLVISVEGDDQSGKPFKEKTVLSYISHEGSSFWLTNFVSIGNELKLTINLPPKLSEGKKLYLIIKGKVAFVEANSDQNYRQRVSLRFDNKYTIKSEE